jgi:Flp pilus assembly protein TadG
VTTHLRVRAPGRPHDSGQSTVEFALVLPFVMLLLLGLLQAGLLLRDQLVVVGAAREGAREAAVSADLRRIQAVAQRAAPQLDLAVQVTRGAKRGDTAIVDVRARPTALPLVGGIVSGRKLSANAVMRVEKAGRAGRE